MNSQMVQNRLFLDENFIMTEFFCQLEICFFHHLIFQKKWNSDK